MTDRTSGFFPLKRQEYCQSSEHNPPSHLYIPPNKGYRHVCQFCGATVIIIPNEPSMVSRK